jgi:hypothetical protein
MPLDLASVDLEFAAMSPPDSHALIRLRIDQLLEEERHHRRRLRLLRGLSWICVLAGIAFPILAGSALLGSPDLFGPKWKLWGGILVLLAAVLTAIHKGLNCEAHHAECRRVIHQIRDLIESYEAALVLGPDDPEPQVATLEARRRELRSQAFEVPPARQVESRGRA